MTRIIANDPICRALHRTYSATTVFTRSPYSHHSSELIVGPYDAQQITYTYENNKDWKSLAFHHIQRIRHSTYTLLSQPWVFVNISQPQDPLTGCPSFYLESVIVSLGALEYRPV